MEKVIATLMLGVFIVCGVDSVYTEPRSGINQPKSYFKEGTPSCPPGETCTIDKNCQAPDGRSYCAKTILIKECPTGQSVCKLYDGTTGCSTCCDGIPECLDLSDEDQCIKYKCDGEWRRVFENDKNGIPTFGNKATLVEAVRQGAEVKIFNGDNYVATAGKVIIIDAEVCFQHILHISKGSWSTFQSKAYWWMTVMCTSGDRSMTRWYFGTHSSASNNQDRTSLKWFIRNIPDKPRLLIPSTGRELEALTHAVSSSGYGVRVKQSSVKNEEFHISDNIEVDQDTRSLVSQVVWDVETAPHNTVLKVSDSGNWIFKNFATDGLLELSRYSIGENTRVGKSSMPRSPSEWFFNPCWEMIYANSADGGRTDGSLQSLIDAVLAGNRVKVMVNNRISQTSVIRLNGGVVTAMLPNLLNKSNISTLEHPINAGAKWEWLLVNTRGKVETARYLVGEPTGTISTSTADIKWFVDRRQWKMVLDVGPSDTVNSGSKVQLAGDIKNGADVRFAWVTTNNEYTVMEMDNLSFEGKTSDFAAIHIRSLLLTSVGNEYKFEVSSGTPTWLFSSTITTGTINMMKWEVGNHVARGASTVRSRIVWWTAM